MPDSSTPPSAEVATLTRPIKAFRARLEARDGVSGISCSVCGAWAAGLLVSGVEHAESCSLIGESSIEALEKDQAAKAQDSQPAVKPRRIVRKVK